MLQRGLPLIVLGLAALYLVQAWSLPFGTLARPGAGFYPTAVGVFACLVALIATAQGLAARPARRGPVAEDPATPVRRRRVLGTTAAMAGFCLALPWIGYPVAACAFVAAVLRVVGSRWSAAVLIGALGALASYLLFAVLLDVPLPRGPW